MLKIFHSEIKELVNLLGELLKQEKDRGFSDRLYDPLSNLLRSLYGGSKILKLEGYSRLLKSMEEYFEKLHTHTIGWNEAGAAIIAKIYSMFLGVVSNESKIPELDSACYAMTEQMASKSLHGTFKAADQSLLLDDSILALFRTDLEMQLSSINNGLINLENLEDKSEQLEELMRAAHSIKGAARVVKFEPIVRLAHAIEELFVSVQEHQITLLPEHVDIIFKATDLLTELLKIPTNEYMTWLQSQEAPIQNIIEALAKPDAREIPKSTEKNLSLKQIEEEQHVVESIPGPVEVKKKREPVGRHEEKNLERVLRVTAKRLNRLMGLAGESLVESRHLEPFSNAFLKIKKDLYELSEVLDSFSDLVEEENNKEILKEFLLKIQRGIYDVTQSFSGALSEWDLFALRSSSIADRLYHEVIETRMRPFADGIEDFPRMVRDLSRELGKQIRLEVLGKSTPVDREILEKIKAPLNHLIRNAIDHGIRSPSERIKMGKNPEGVIRLEASLQGGSLSIVVSDDGEGVDISKLQSKILEKKLLTEDMIGSFSEEELLEFLFLPGFSTASKVTEISGRGVGLNVVKTMIQEISGNLKIKTTEGKGVSFSLALPLTLAVIRVLLVQIAEEVYAFPLGRIESVAVTPAHEVKMLENIQYIKFQGNNIGLVSAYKVFNLNYIGNTSTELSIIILNDYSQKYGIVVDRFLGERELVVHDLDPRLGKIPNISSGAILEDGAPVLIVEVEELIHSIGRILSTDGEASNKIADILPGREMENNKRILVIDDSITIREIESRLLRSQGYDVHCAVDGLEGWNLLFTKNFDLIITDLDMPRLSGIELIKMVRSNDKFKNIPIVIVSYKEKKEFQESGIEAGANCVLMKSRLQDGSFIKTVNQLTGAV